MGWDRRRTILNAAGVLVLVVVVVPFVVTAVPQLVGADETFIVLSSSMAPTYQAGDVVFVNDVRPSAIESGDVITFEPPSGHENEEALRVTHRVVDVVDRNGSTYFRTKGDANEEPDQTLVPAENVVGVVWFAIPWLGYVISFGGSTTGIVLLVFVPVALLILTELWNLLRSNGEG